MWKIFIQGGTKIDAATSRAFSTLKHTKKSYRALKMMARRRFLMRLLGRQKLILCINWAAKKRNA